MIKKDWFIVRNLRLVIYQYIDKIIKLDTLKWLKLIAGLFNLQMTILKMFIKILLGKSRDTCCLNQYYNALRYSKVSKNMKNFYIWNDFFKIIINTNMIVFYILSVGCKNISKYKR